MAIRNVTATALGDFYRTGVKRTGVNGVCGASNLAYIREMSKLWRDSKQYFSNRTAYGGGGVQTSAVNLLQYDISILLWRCLSL